MRQRFPKAERSSALWPSERGARMSPGSLGDACRWIAPGVGSALPQAFLRDPPDRSRLRRGFREDAGWALLRFDDRSRYIGIVGLQQKTVQQMIARRIANLEDPDA